MTIEHVQPSEWAVVGARLERCQFASFFRNGKYGWAAFVKLDGGVDNAPSGFGDTPLEALTAALDAAEGAK